MPFMLNTAHILTPNAIRMLSGVHGLTGNGAKGERCSSADDERRSSSYAEHHSSTHAGQCLSRYHKLDSI